MIDIITYCKMLLFIAYLVLSYCPLCLPLNPPNIVKIGEWPVYLCNSTSATCPFDARFLDTTWPARTDSCSSFPLAGRSVRTFSATPSPPNTYFQASSRCQPLWISRFPAFQANALSARDGTVSAPADEGLFQRVSRRRSLARWLIYSFAFGGCRNCVCMICVCFGFGFRFPIVVCAGLRPRVPWTFRGVGCIWRWERVARGRTSCNGDLG